MSKLDPAVTNVFHDVCNTYQAVLFYIEHGVGSKEDIKRHIESDQAAMTRVAKEHSHE